MQWSIIYFHHFIRLIIFHKKLQVVKTTSTRQNLLKKNSKNFRVNKKKCCKNCLVAWRSMAHRLGFMRLFYLHVLLITMSHSSSNSGVIFVADSSTCCCQVDYLIHWKYPHFILDTEWKVHNAAKFESAINKWWLLFSTVFFRVPKPNVSTIAACFPVLKCRNANFMATQNLGLAIQTEWNFFFSVQHPFYLMARVEHSNIFE